MDYFSPPPSSPSRRGRIKEGEDKGGGGIYIRRRSNGLFFK